MSDDPRWRIILVRCASPPDSEPAERSSERYPRPICTNDSRVCSSFTRRGATDGSSRRRTQSARSLICIAHASAMLIPAIFDERAASLRREPPQSGQAVKVAARSTNARMCGCRESGSLERNDFCTLETRPS